MDLFHEDPESPELTDLARRLREERPQATGFELDRMHAQTRAKVSNRSRPASRGLKGAFVKSRLAIGLLLVAGFAMTGTGGALAISGSSGKVSAAQAQYCPPGQTNPDYCQQCPPGQTNPDYCNPDCPTGSTNPDYCQSCPPGSTNPDYCDYTEQPDAQGPSVEAETQSSNPKKHKDPKSGTKAAEADGTPAAAVQAAAQTSSDAKGDLPFTGFAAIPVILVGFGLVLAGAFLRRESRRNLG
jgi:hypothetical protein